MPEPTAVTALTRVGRRGWELHALDAPAATWGDDAVLVTGGDAAVRVPLRADPAQGSAVHHLERPVAHPTAFEVHDATGRVLLRDTDVALVRTAGADAFAAEQHGPVRLRLRAAAAPGPRPLLLFLHGGAEAGDDNHAQLVGTFGPVHLAQRYPDVHVLAPQAPAPAGGPPPHRPFAESDLDPTSGWHRAYLAAVCDVVRGMVADGRVDPDRVYLTGVSMGGAGALRALSVAPDLFTAAAPVCPTMTPETFGILRGLDRTRLWLSTAYVDHTPYRHKYLVDGVLHLRDRGNADAHLTLFSPEQLARHGVADRDDLPLDALLRENHLSWVATYEDEDGILSWLMSRVGRPATR
ncbi:prolyl oligopeptidase family serine peptidase [Cellulomonas iranensis]|uniref:alpha/beta fold hydrolase n=1 Tax=Cellulomonas iranensis TaxID=76862 RepID=UPI001CF0DB2D|nr:alpha/beta fold hydrolase [Cellulomonas iranensis]UCN13685.1 prolyl oligopeptidase family serine peptidase [Cellulomonas iranensis]